MKFAVLASICFLLALPTVAFAQAPTIERQVKGKPDANINAGIFTTVRQDCTAGPLPVVRLVTPPAHGDVTMNQGGLRATKSQAMLWYGGPGLHRDLPVSQGFCRRRQFRPQGRKIASADHGHRGRRGCRQVNIAIVQVGGTFQ